MLITYKIRCAFLLMMVLIFCMLAGSEAAKIAASKSANGSVVAKGTEAATAATEETAASTKPTPEVAAAAAAAEEASDEDDDDEDEEDDDDADDAAATGDTSEKQTAVQAGDDTTDTSLSMWGIVRSVWNWLRNDLSESLLGDDTKSPAARTFGKIRRLQMALIPIIFKFGILSAMVAFLVMLGMKTLFLVKLLVLMNAAVILGKFLTLKTNLGHSDYSSHSAPAQPWAYSNWSPPHGQSGWSSSSSVAATAPAAVHPSKEIHLHIHGAQAHPQVSAYSSYSQPQGSAYSSYGSTGGQTQHTATSWDRRSDPYGLYEPAPVSETDGDGNEFTPMAPIAVLPSRYPANHRAQA